MAEPAEPKCKKCGIELIGAPGWQTYCKPCYAQVMREKEQKEQDPKAFMPAEFRDDTRNKRMAVLKECIADVGKIWQESKDVEGAIPWKSEDLRAMALSLFIQRCRDG